MDFTMLEQSTYTLGWAVFNHVVGHADLRFLHLECVLGDYCARMFGYAHDTIRVAVLPNPTRITVKYEWDGVELEQRVVWSSEVVDAFVADMARNLRA